MPAPTTRRFDQRFNGVAQPPDDEDFETVRCPRRGMWLLLFVVGTRAGRQFIAGPVAAVFAFAPICSTHAQDMMRGPDLPSPDMTMAEMTRAKVLAELAAAAEHTDRRGR